MLLWRLSGRQHAQALDGGYGLHFDGRWNSVGHAVTYCATSPSLCVLEKLVHIEDPGLLPELIMVTYDVPDTLGVETVDLDDLPSDWRRQEVWTQQRGDAWHQARSTPLLRVPSAIVPIVRSPDLNIVVNHSHSAASEMKIIAAEPFVLDPRLF
ncbi:RES family NAD+ phosphorylase [Neorhizobium galegae]|uniref:RES family NAD+ phosphorylase n=1 Tax=Neorhizobium galegae TaxID=399 RepID=UPI0006227820|nr:RES family NAD+ phosphorylase [Neorhizobium galegae]CDZ62131.1 RES domain protein [Neorhizobium galegae bv. orientalis]KAB1122064.1 RES family NAD+ phosphorylase [Neorhizobium galegae]MCQ1574224.1 RES family NAD+ phosphorylase [Neorhizobium galegae]MCQ1810508.1 RES family NAD+ phosphorylase [Neorhizobium galegae]MCQ1837604.1 RES family NAD+ phosphorylase [Neorhizobium galegae]